MKRHVVLPNHGVLFVSTDVHGNGDDFRQMRRVFEAQIAEDSDTYWAILGDAVHGPSRSARQRNPALYDYDDESIGIVQEIVELQAAYPERVLFVLGNHDWAHVGGPLTRKFFPDEAENLERDLSLSQKTMLHGLFNDALLCIITPCGAFLSHGVPGVQLESMEEIDQIADFHFAAHNPRHMQILSSMLTSYGQPEPVIRAFLETVSDLGVEQRFVIHGHDRDETGFFTDGDWALCPVIFGAARQNKRYVRLDLSASYTSAQALTQGHQILRLFGDH